MAILGTLVDKQTISRAGDDLDGTTVATLSHSLPATNPEMFLPILRSVQGIVGNGFPGAPAVLGLGGNASILTVGYNGGSAPSFPTIMFDVFAAVFHSIVR